MYAEKLAEQKKKAEEFKKQKDARDKRIEQALKNLVGNRDFETIIRWLAEESGWFDDLRVLDPATREILHGATDFNLGCRQMYVILRRRMTDEMKRAIETKQEGTNGGESTGSHNNERSAGSGTGGPIQSPAAPGVPG